VIQSRVQSSGVGAIRSNSKINTEHGRNTRLATGQGEGDCAIETIPICEGERSLPVFRGPLNEITGRGNSMSH
jgi:hypothetical protein